MNTAALTLDRGPRPAPLPTDRYVVDASVIRSLPARQQPGWAEHPRLGEVTTALRAAPPLVEWDTVEALRACLADAARGTALVVQAGDCAEDPAESQLHDAVHKAGVVQSAANALQRATGRPVVRVGRIGGQFAKPRSADVERHSDGTELPVYRGHVVNGPEATLEARTHDPERLLAAHRAAADLQEHITRICPGATEPIGRGHHLWTSHEALVLDYELPQVHDGPRGHYLASTHWPWVGNRTNAPDEAHVAFLASIANPVAVKVGPQVGVEDVLALAERLDPEREPGRLTLISRMGAHQVDDKLPPLMAAVQAAGHPVLWLSDPMHGNTVTTASGRKTRHLTAIIAEARGFVDACRRLGIAPGGLHLEVAAGDVAECSSDPDFVPADGRYTSLCDPRLNLDQALLVISAFARLVR